MSDQYHTHFVPIESDPDIFNFLLHSLGATAKLVFEEVYTLDEPDLLPHPALALILIFPTSDAYESRKALEEASTIEHLRNVVWFKQTINNACGLYALLHAVCNGDGKGFIEPGSFFAKLLDEAPQSRTRMLEDSEQLKTVYAEAANKGATTPPNAEDEVNFHYICFVKTSQTSPIYELDGDRKGPVDRGIPHSSDDDVLMGTGLDIIKEAIGRENGESIGFSLLALTVRNE